MSARPSIAAAVKPANPPPKMAMSVYRMAPIPAEGPRLTPQQKKSLSYGYNNTFCPGIIILSLAKR